jgi:hypothetical protein
MNIRAAAFRAILIRGESIGKVVELEHILDSGNGRRRIYSKLRDRPESTYP